MDGYIAISIFVLLASGVVRALYEIMSFGSGGENAWDKPAAVIWNPWIPDLATFLLLAAIVGLGYFGFVLHRWVGMVLIPVITFVVGAPFVSALLRERASTVSLYYSSPFLQLPIFIVALVAFLVFFN